MQEVDLKRIEAIVHELLVKEHKRLKEGGESSFAYWFLDSTNRAFGFVGKPYSAPKDINSSKALSFITHLLALASGAEVVIQIVESYISEFCGYCGAKMDNADVCSSCKKEAMLYKNNIFSREVIVVHAKIVSTEGSLVWMNEIIRDEAGKVIGFKEEEKCTWLPLEPMLGDYWQIEDWMSPHFLHNYLPVSQALGTTVKDFEDLAKKFPKFECKEFITVDKGFLNTVSNISNQPLNKEITNG